MNEEEVFHEALARKPEERAAYLDQACAGDPARRASVEALLQVNVGATGFLEHPSPPTTELPAEGLDPSASLGAMIGPYKLLEQIGEGGFGVVYLAEQTEPVRRKVALEDPQARHGHAPDRREIRSRAASPGDHGPSEYREGL